MERTVGVAMCLRIQAVLRDVPAMEGTMARSARRLRWPGRDQARMAATMSSRKVLG